MDNDFNKLTDFTNIGLDKYMMPLDSPITSPSALPGILFDMQNEINGRFARLSNVNIKNFIVQTGSSGVGFGLANNGSVVIVSSVVLKPPHQSEPMFAQPFVAVYQGTAPSGTGQIFPVHGAGVDPSKWNIKAGYDFGVYQSGTTTNYALSVVNQTGGSLDMYFATNWKYLQYNAGTNV